MVSADFLRELPPGYVLLPSKSSPGQYHLLANVGTPFVIHAGATCQANESDRDCWHVLAALEIALEEPMDQPNETTLAIAERQPQAVRAAEMGLKVASHLGAWNDLLELGKGMLASGMLPPAILNPEAAALVMLKAYTLDISPGEAFDFIDIIEGRPALRAQMIRALVTRSGKGTILIPKSDSQECVAIGNRPGVGRIEVRYTIEDAQRAGLTGKKNWKEHPADMLVARATARVGRRLFADVLSGMDTAWVDESGSEAEYIGSQGDADSGGTVIEGEARDVTNEPTPEPAPAEPEWKAELDALKREHGVSNDEIAGVLGERPTVKSVQAWLDADDSRSIARLVSNALDRREPAEAVAPFI